MEIGTANFIIYCHYAIFTKIHSYDSERFFKKIFFAQNSLETEKMGKLINGNFVKMLTKKNAQQKNR